MILLLPVAQATSAIDAERAFARDAQTLGQWPAFAKWAAPDAVMFVPRPVKAQDWLKGRKGPRVAVQWWPSETWLSCDGQIAINRGPWIRDGGKSTGWFTTVWQRSGAGWRWLLDHGDAAEVAVRAHEPPVIRRANCSRPGGEWQIPVRVDGMVDTGNAADGSLHWTVNVGNDGERYFWVRMWEGRRWVTVLDQHVVAETP